MIRLIGVGTFEEAMAGGLVACPGCGGRLIRWGWDRARGVRCSFDRFGPVRVFRRRRVRCKGCGATHVVQAPELVDRHRDGADVIREVFRVRAGGSGFRAAAEMVDRAFSTVRGWFRALEGGAAWAVALAARGG